MSPDEVRRRARRTLRRAPSSAPRRVRTPGLRPLLLAAVVLLGGGASACSPIYVIKAGIAEARILHARRPIAQVIDDSSTDAATRAKLEYILKARRFAAQTLGMHPGKSYTTYVHLKHDTLALVLSAAYKDRLVNKTWWFPIVGNVPYKGFFSETDALHAQHKLEAKGFDTYLRPTSAFSTLGWFSDPILSTMLQGDDAVGVVETILHELTHRYLFVSGHVRFNESMADFVGWVGAARFFCSPSEGGPDSAKCLSAQARWRDFERFSVFVDTLVSHLNRVYDDSTLTYAQKLARRKQVFAQALTQFKQDVQPTLEAYTFQSFLDTPLNNATLLAQMRYFHRLPDFQSLLDEHGGDLRAVLEYLHARVPKLKNPWDALPTNGTLPPPKRDTAR